MLNLIASSSDRQDNMDFARAAAEHATHSGSWNPSEIQSLLASASIDQFLSKPSGSIDRGREREILQALSPFAVHSVTWRPQVVGLRGWSSIAYNKMLDET